MLDSDGYRPNVGIILTNDDKKVFWAKRLKKPAWQLPQGGIDEGEDIETALMRELNEEIGLTPDDVKIIAHTSEWLYYDVPEPFRRADRSIYRGQKQIWFLLKLVGPESKINLFASSQPEFDAWRWNDYWVPLRDVMTNDPNPAKTGYCTDSESLPALLVRRGHFCIQFHTQKKSKSSLIAKYLFTKIVSFANQNLTNLLIFEIIFYLFSISYIFKK